jgi:hypothetical protein
MEKYKLFLTLYIVLLFCSGCGSERININLETKNQCEQILDYLSNNDSDGLKDLFCATVSSESDFDNQLLEALDFFDGKVVSYDIQSTGANERIVDGKQAEIHISPYIGDIMTDANKTYNIKYYSYLVNVENPNDQGLSELAIECGDGQIFVLGNFETVHNDD